MYNPDIFGGNLNEFRKKRIALYDIYVKYEEYFSLDEKIRQEKLIEWGVKELKLMIHPNFRKESIKKMVEFKSDKKQINFKKNIKEFYEKLIELNIPIIIV